MEAILKPPGNFNLTPHKVSICILLQIYAPPDQVTLPFPFPFSSVAQHNRLGMFLLAITKSSDDIFEPKMGELIGQLRDIGVELDHWLSDNLTCRLSSLSSPDDLFNFFSDLRGIVTGPDSGVVGDDQIILDASSYLGVFVRRCILAFNLLSFEGVCHLLTNIGTYCKEALSSCSAYELPRLGNSRNDNKALEYENMDLENFVFDKVTEDTKLRKMAIERVPFHIHSPKALSGLIVDIVDSAEPKFKHKDQAGEASLFAHKMNDTVKSIDPNGGIFLRTNWQIQGYLCEQADAIEKQNSSFLFNSFESILGQLQKFAPELHRVHFLRYLNNLYHNDYPASLENLHCYFDYSAGEEGFDSIQRTLSANNGRFEIALLCLGIMHFHFGHPKLSLEALTEAVRISQQQHNDTCLAYTLAAICNLLSAVGISSTTGIFGSSYRPVTTIGTSLSIQQLLFVLLKRSLKRADSLKLKRLLASNRLAMAKFDLTHVQRPLLSFGPKASMKLKTCPVNVCKELRLSSQLITEFSTESSIMITDGAFSTAWLKDLPVGSFVFSLENASGVNSNAFHYCAQPSSVPGSVLQLLGSSYLLRATAWELYGSAPLARINLLVHATCFARASSSADVALAYTKLIQQLAVFRGYKEAFAALRLVEERFLSISKSQILLLKLQLLHEHALHLGHLKRAQKLCDELGVLASSVSGVAMELKTEASLRHARTLLAANQFSQAAAVAHSLFCMCYKFNLQVENATVLLLLAEIHKKSGNAVLGLPYALASLSFCQLFNLDLLRASATLTLAELWLSLGPNHAERASILIQQALPMILGHGGLELRARAYIAEAKCYISNHSFSVFENSEVVLDPLRQATEDLELLEYHELAAEAFYLMAMVFNKLGQPEEREEAAASFMKHINALENPNVAEDPLISIS